MKNFLFIPKNFLAVSLCLILSTSLLQFEAAHVLRNLTLAVGTAVALDLLLLKLRGIPSIFPNAAIVSGLIIALLIAPTLPPSIIVTASLLAVFGKHFGRILQGKPIFNPAAAGLFISAMVFSQPVSWWGVSWGVLPLVLIVIFVGYLVLFRMRRLRIPLSFLTTNLLFSVALNPFPFTFSSLLDPTLLFFTLVMLPEPMTSPNSPTKQILYGAFVAIAVVFFSSPMFNVTFPTSDPLLASLLLGNLVFFRMKE